MKKVFHLKKCGTCQKILQRYDLGGWEIREIKSKPLSAQELEQMCELAGSYEALFSKRSTQIRARNIETQTLSEDEFRDLLLDHYSFLKRPVFITGDKIFIGNDKKSIAALDEFFGIE
ncbi:arsenate reductase family protein [Cruoricaptor ignavus]|uniref:Arsenate reductase family protein n=1 Tax=Cruoricaptor ignavus TaxID=1118202 RepID=A0A7M1T1Z8_9FLAO|nr:ArsC/Spx/MgsR family protein [Cruoricaptor ignavus]QOR73888.1 arsenate reductase family protein [Cruoricaptor ignavus]